MDNSVASLAHWQQHFAESLPTHLQPELRKTLHGLSETAAEQRFSIYQNNVFYSLTTALGDLYPVIKKLVGDAFFSATAAIYLRENMPNQAAMVYFAQDFPDFLRRFEQTQHLPYLAAVADLELARQRAYHAPDQTPLSVDDFSQIAAEQLATASVELHPSLQIVQAQQPIFTIWQANQNDGVHTEENISLDAPQQVLVIRPEYDLLMYQLDKATCHFIVNVLANQCFQEAIENTVNDHPTFDIRCAVNFIVTEQLLSAIHHHKT